MRMQHSYHGQQAGGKGGYEVLPGAGGHDGVMGTRHSWSVVGCHHETDLEKLARIIGKPAAKCERCVSGGRAFARAGKESLKPTFSETTVNSTLLQCRCSPEENNIHQYTPMYLQRPTTANTEYVCTHIHGHPHKHRAFMYDTTSIGTSIPHPSTQKQRVCVYTITYAHTHSIP